MLKIFRSVAGIDEEVLSGCPRSDHIWTTQIGIALSLTFLIVSFIVFYSLLYINGSSVAYDVALHSIVFKNASFAPLSYAAFAAIALIIATVVFLFDRTLYQSDWFMELPYGEETKEGEKFAHHTKMAFRVIVRLLISLGLAYVLSIFLELKLYESIILPKMQQDHMQQNKKLYDSVEAYAKSIDMRITTLRKNEQRLLAVLSRLKNRENPLPGDQYLNSINENISSLGNASSLVAKIDEMENEIGELDLQLSAELGGLADMKVGKKALRSSGIKGFGPRARAISTRILSLKNQIKTLRSRLERIRTLQKEKQAYVAKEHQRLLQSSQEIFLQKEAQLRETREELKRLSDNRVKMESDKMQTVMQSPQFVQFRDGPMSRVATLEEIRQDPKIGKEILLFGWIVKIFLIFLEVVPVMSKMLFGPPSVYASRLQDRIRMEIANSKLEKLEHDIHAEERRRELHSEQFRTRVGNHLHHNIIQKSTA